MKKLALALKNTVGLNFCTVLKYFLSFRIFEHLALALKNRVCPEFFTILNRPLFFTIHRIFE